MSLSSSIKLVFVADEFRVGSPVQRLLDRFLMGYPVEGKFHKPSFDVVLVTPQKTADIERRMNDFNLLHQSEPIAGDATVIFAHPPSFLPAPRSFAYGVSKRSLPGGVAGTAVRGGWLLPQLSIGSETPLRKGLVIVQGEYPIAEVEALDAILPLTWRSGTWVRKIALLNRANFWEVLKRDFWALVKSAISRSDSPQGGAVADGRTQDLVGRGMLETLVKSPRGWLIEHEDGFCYVIAVMDGGVADFNIALQTRAGGILSAQVHRGQSPGEHHYSRLAAMLERYFRTGEPPWPLDQTAYSAELIEHFDATYGDRNR